MKAGEACDALQVPPLLRWQRSRQRVARRSPLSTARRGTAHARTARRSRCLRLHRTYRFQVERNRYVATGRCSRPRPTQLMSVARSLLEEPSAHGEREHLATLAGCPAGRLEDDRHDLHRRQRRRLRSDRLKDGSLLHAPCVLRRPRGLKGNHARYSARNALTARTKQYGLGFMLFGVRRLHLSAAAFAILKRTARYDSYLHKSRPIISLSSLSVQSKWFENSGAIDISTAP
jgi:hypothetical protein